MKVKITRSNTPLQGTVKAPPSKSAAHRYLICAALADGTTTLTGIEYSDDILATLDLVKSLGATCKINGSTVTIAGADPFKAAPAHSINCRESATTLRLALPLCLLSGNTVEICAEKSLLARPLDVYTQLCRERGLTLQKNSNSLTVRGSLHGGAFSVRGDISSQFISGLLLALPLCGEDSTLEIIPPFESRPYVNMTLDTMKKFGIEIASEGELCYRIKGGQKYRPADAPIEVEGDFSNAAFFDALNLLGHSVTVIGLSQDSAQGDKIYPEYFERLKQGTPTLDISDCPDLAPVIMALAAAQNGAVLTGTRRLGFKESDRGRAMAVELAKLGAEVTVAENRIEVRSAPLRQPTAPLSSHGDHRIAMSLSALATLTGGVIEGAEAVNKSLPQYFELLQSLGAEVRFL